MRSGGEKICPAGMVLKATGGAGPHPDEADYCVEITEVDQKSGDQFLLVVKKKDGSNYDVPKPEGNLKGPKKPAIYFTMEEARAYCRWKYPGGDLPTNNQWERACGDKEYCTASGEFRHAKAISASCDKGPVDVDSYAANPQGVKNMTGNVRERTRELNEDGWNIVRGSSWCYSVFANVRADAHGHYEFPGQRYGDIGFRCVAPPKDSTPVRLARKK